MIEKKEIGSRKSALVVGGILAALAAWNLFYRHRLHWAEVLGGVAAALLVVGLFLPSWAGRFDRAWMRLARALGYVNSRVLLTTVYYLVITPFGLIMRLLGRDPLRRRDSGRDSYWIRRPTSRQTKEGFERSF